MADALFLFYFFIGKKVFAVAFQSDVHPPAKAGGAKKSPRGSSLPHKRQYHSFPLALLRKRVPFSAENGKGLCPLIPPLFRKAEKHVLEITCLVKNNLAVGAS
ncbi:hypothetical protein [Clostridium sp. D33t1_170424_F3]|uniref:hypothetical protein n=1 Tax=Clostridium sp. D33t1_170424_F3 TaxID=2787099 RepID=UPI0018AB94CB|nr:hypothetical protein [Clostridium sp. D33t1_170424_F3]